MSNTASLTELRQQSVSPVELASKLRNPDGQSKANAEALLAKLKPHASNGHRTSDLLACYIDMNKIPVEQQARFTIDGKLMDPVSALFMAMDIPLHENPGQGISLQLAADTFNTFEGSRVLFPLAVDAMLRWNYRQTQFEDVSQIVAQSRTISGNELLTTVVADSEADYTTARPIAETANIPIASIRATESSLKFWKYGFGMRTSYEFSRRVSLNMLVPYAARIQRQIEIGKMTAATGVLINGHPTTSYGASPVVTQSSFNTPAGSASVNGRLSMPHLLCWLVSRAQAGTPITTIVGNWDAYVAWILTFASPQPSGEVVGDTMAKMGFRTQGLPILNGIINFVPSSSMPAGRLLGFDQAMTLEEVMEAGSTIEESETAIRNQTVTYVRTETSGFRLVYGDTRSTFNYAA
jgi:hypothetical protein